MHNLIWKGENICSQYEFNIDIAILLITLDSDHFNPNIQSKIKANY